MKAGHRSDFDRAIARYEEKVRFEAYDLNKGQYGDGKKVEQKPGTKFKKSYIPTSVKVQEAAKAARRKQEIEAENARNPKETLTFKNTYAKQVVDMKTALVSPISVNQTDTFLRTASRILLII